MTEKTSKKTKLTAEERAEKKSFFRVAELRRNPVQGNFDKAHLMEVHRRIFQDSPEHRPGQYREPAKGHYKLRNLETPGVGHSTPYMQQAKVDKRLDEVLDKAGGVAGFKNLSAKETQIKPTFHARLGHHLTAFHKKPPELPFFSLNQSLQAAFPLFFTPLPVLQTRQCLGV